MPREVWDDELHRNAILRRREDAGKRLRKSVKPLKPPAVAPAQPRPAGGARHMPVVPATSLGDVAAGLVVVIGLMPANSSARMCQPVVLHAGTRCVGECEWVGSPWRSLSLLPVRKALRARL